jgi:cytochrome c oxidase subunit 3
MGAAISVEGHGAGDAVDHDRKVRLGMLFYVLTDVILVAFLFAAYIWLRAYNTNGGWFPAQFQLPDTTMTLVLLALIVVSAASYFVALQGIRAGNQLMLRVGLTVALALVIVALVEQVRFMGQQQFATGDGSFASTYIMLSGYHVYHMCIGVFLGLGLTIRAWRGRYSQQRHLGLITVGYFWYWMALMPVLLTVLMAVLPPNA